MRLTNTDRSKGGDPLPESHRSKKQVNHQRGKGRLCSFDPRPRTMAYDIITETSRTDLDAFDASASTSITKVQHLSSYNWIEAPKATPAIAVPGSPGLWSPPTEPRQLAQDTGRYFIAQNAARLPENPLEPLFRALYVFEPSFDVSLIDIVTDRNNIRKLLGFVQSSVGQIQQGRLHSPC